MELGNSIFLKMTKKDVKIEREGMKWLKWFKCGVEKDEMFGNVSIISCIVFPQYFMELKPDPELYPYSNSPLRYPNYD